MIGYFVNQVLPNLIASVLWVPIAALASWSAVRLHMARLRDAMLAELCQHISADLRRHLNGQDAPSGEPPAQRQAP